MNTGTQEKWGMLRTPRSSLNQITLSSGVVQAIIDGILDGQLACGQRLKETEVAKWLGVSRTPVREAFARLERQSLLRKDTSRSHIVAKWTTKDLKELASLRSALEALVVELVVPEFSDRDFEYLESVVTQMETALKRDDLNRLFELDIQFHSYLWRAANHERLMQVFQDIQVQIYFFMRITRPGDEYDYPNTHRILIESFKSKDIPKARIDIQTHIQSTAERAITRIDERQIVDGLGKPAGRT
jgi:DNA-binding GntR family transcriptional regulator